MRYRKKPVEVDVQRFTVGWTDKWELEKFFGESYEDIYIVAQDDPGGLVSSLAIPTLEGVMEVSDGDFIIKGVKGEFYPCKPDIFEQTYEEIT